MKVIVLFLSFYRYMDEKIIYIVLRLLSCCVFEVVFGLIKGCFVEEIMNLGI